MNREFQFDYRFDGSEWGIRIPATDEAEARERIKAIGWAQYKGEIGAVIPVPGGGLVARVIAWWKNR